MKATPQTQFSENFVQARNRSERLNRFARALQLKLAASGWGRIALHVLVAFKTGDYVWHLQGIAREFVRE